MLPQVVAEVFKRLVRKKDKAAHAQADHDLTVHQDMVVEQDLVLDEDCMDDQKLRLSFRHDVRFGRPSQVTTPAPAPPSTRLRHTRELLDMPLEVLQLCLTYATTPSFLQLIATCHRLWDLAANTRAVVLHHLARVPGIKLGIDDFVTATPDLFRTLRRRACLHLYGAHWYADRTDYTFKHSAFDASASCLRAGKTFGIALVANDAVRLFCLTPEGLTYRGETLADPNMSISQTAIDEAGDVAVLYASGPRANDVYRNGQFLMVYHKRVDDQYSPVLYSYLEGCQGYKAASMVVSDHDVIDVMAMVLSRGDLSRDADSRRANMAVVRHLLKHPAQTRADRRGKGFRYASDLEAVAQSIQLYPPLPKEDIGQPLSRTIKFDLPEGLKPPPVRVTFCDKGQKLKCYAAGCPVPSFRLNINGDLASHPSAVGKVHIGHCDFLVDDPFCGKHETFQDHLRGRRQCTVSYLALGLMVSSGSIVSESPFAACIIRARRTYNHQVCRHLVNLDSSLTRSFNRDVVGRLWGYKGASMTSLPGIVAYSRNATRIAIADWDKILIWALNGDVLMDCDAGSRYYDMVWDSRFRHEHVVLKPILLQAGSVVRQMAFGTNENELVVLTSKGVQIWNLGASGTGSRVLHYLDEREKEESTVG